MEAKMDGLGRFPMMVSRWNGRPAAAFPSTAAALNEALLGQTQPVSRKYDNSVLNSDGVPRQESAKGAFRGERLFR
jgi:hypothetical protein